MDDLGLLLRYATRLLIILAPLEFLLGRAISRAARQMPAGDLGAAVFGAIGSMGAFLVMPAFLLVLLVLVLAAILGLRPGSSPVLAGDKSIGDPGLIWPRPLSAALIVFLVASVALLVPGTPAPLLVVYNVLSAGLVLGTVAAFVARARAGRAVRVTLALFGLAYGGYYIYALAAILAQAGGLPLGEIGLAANACGEAAGQAAAISLFWAAGPLAPVPAARRIYPLPLALAGLAAAGVLIGALFEQWLQGVATQFSVGFTLFLPVPVQALALAGWVYAVLVANSRPAAARTGLPWAWELGAGLLLLPAAGYQLQLNYQHLLLVATLLLLTGLLRPFSGRAGPAPEPAAVPVLRET